MSFFREYYNRIKSPTPSFFKKMIKIGGIMSAGGIAAAQVPNPKLSTVAGYIAAMGGTMVAVSIAAKKDTPETTK